jgi:Na+(H+)/acetate symporter ActP
VILSRLVAIGFLGSIFAMFRFAKYCRLLNGHDLEQEEAERYQARAQRWLAAAGTLLGTAVLSIIACGIFQ